MKDLTNDELADLLRDLKWFGNLTSFEQDVLKEAMWRLRTMETKGMNNASLPTRFA